MENTRHYHLSLLYFAHILINVDEVIDSYELKGVQTIVDYENIPIDLYQEYKDNAKHLSEQTIYEIAVDAIRICSHRQKLNTFAWLYRLSQADGNIHDKEIRFLLYSIKYAGIALEDAISCSKTLPELAV